LRNASSTTTTTTTAAATKPSSTGTLDNNHHLHHHHNNNNLAFSNSHSNTPSLFNASRRTSAAPPQSRITAVPDTVFPNWQPSERVSRMNPDLVTLHSSFSPFFVDFTFSISIIVSSLNSCQLNECYMFSFRGFCSAECVSVWKFSILVFRVFRSCLLFI
jgi:hypothetical protein